MFFSIFKNIRRLLYLVLAVIIVFLLIKKPGVFVGSDDKSEILTVTRVIDGDTFLLSNNERVRLIGVDTPEKHQSKKLERDAERSQKDKKTIQKLGEEASDFAKKIIEGKRVRLERDQYSAPKDKYSRLLRYVYLEDGTLINALLIKEGYANAYTQFKFEKEEEFKKLEREARLNKRGLWKQ